MKLMRYFRNKYIETIDKSIITILDIGSNRVRRKHNTYRRIFSSNKYKYTGMDLKKGMNVDIIGYENIKQSYDIVINGQVLEHVKRPWEVLVQWKDYFDKYICIIAPNTFKEHRYPIDTYRYYPDGMQDLFEYAGIEIVEIFKHKTDTIGIGKK